MTRSRGGAPDTTADNLSAVNGSGISQSPIVSLDSSPYEIIEWPKMVEMIPPLASYEYERLEDSILNLGLQNPILTLPDGRIIDGYHRWRICREHGIKPFVRIVPLDEDDAFLLGLSLNLDRRQLSFEQIRDIRENQKHSALELRKQGMTQQETAEIVGVDHRTVGRWEDESASNGQVPITCSILDLRISIPEEEYDSIQERLDAGETQTEIAADYKVSRQRISQISQSVKTGERIPPISLVNLNDEWYTPPEIIEAARETMGKIDLDPASCEMAQQTVRATCYYDKENDGLFNEWYGNVWMNPPFTMPTRREFCERLTTLFVNGAIEQACVLLNNVVIDQAHIQQLLSAASGICLIAGRLNFLHENGDESKSPLWGQFVVYLGNNIEDFEEQFRAFGEVFRRC